jgi:hypothetical protein
MVSSVTKHTLKKLGYFLILAIGFPLGGICWAKSDRVDDSFCAPQGKIKQQVFQWDNFLLKSINSGASLSSKVDNYRKSYGIPIYVWKISKEKNLPFLKDLEGMMEGLGWVFSRSFGFSAEPFQGKIEGGQVLEVDEKGRVLTRWRVPACTSEVDGIEGNELMIVTKVHQLCPSREPGKKVGSGEILLAIKPDGSFKIQNPKLFQFNKSETEINPDLSKKLSKECCEKHKDLQTAKVRLLAFGDACH